MPETRCGTQHIFIVSRLHLKLFSCLSGSIFSHIFNNLLAHMQGVLCCTDCKAPWGNAICCFVQYKWKLTWLDREEETNHLSESEPVQVLVNTHSPFFHFKICNFAGYRLTLKPGFSSSVFDGTELLNIFFLSSLLNLRNWNSQMGRRIIQYFAIFCKVNWVCEYLILSLTSVGTQVLHFYRSQTQRLYMTVRFEK